MARELHGIDDRRTALRTYSVIGGVAAYAREMVAGDLPDGPDDFDRWIRRRVRSPAAPLFSEVPLLLSEDPATAKARKPNLYHAALAGVATGAMTHSDLMKYVKIRGASLAPIVEALTAAHLIERVQDPIRNDRPTHHPGDPLIRFHYAVVRRHQARRARHDADTRRLWREILPTFDSQVIGPTFEALARFWAQHIAGPRTLGGPAVHVGPTVHSDADAGDRQVDVLVAADDGTEPSERIVLALGEAKSGARLSLRHLRRPEAARATLGSRGGDATLLLFEGDFSDALTGRASERGDIELVDLERPYGAE